MTAPVYMRPKDAPTLLGVSTSTFHRWRQEAGDAWHTVKRGNIRLVRFEDVQAWLENQERAGSLGD